jgi:hypothetical protein
MLRRARMSLATRCSGRATYLLHDAGLALAEGDVPTRLVGDELDLDLPALAAGLVVVVVVVVGRRARAFGAAVRVADIEGAAAVVVQLGRRVLVVVGDFRGHGGGEGANWLWCWARMALTALAGVCDKFAARQSLGLGKMERGRRDAWVKTERERPLGELCRQSGRAGMQGRAVALGRTALPTARR